MASQPVQIGGSSAARSRASGLSLLFVFPLSTRENHFAATAADFIAIFWG